MMFRLTALAAGLLVAVAGTAEGHMVVTTPGAADGNAGLPDGNTAQCTTYAAVPAGGSLTVDSVVAVSTRINVPHGGGIFVLSAHPADNAAGNMTFSGAGLTGMPLTVFTGENYPSTSGSHAVTASWPNGLPPGRGWLQVSMQPASGPPDYIQCVFYTNAATVTTGSTTGTPPPPPPPANSLGARSASALAALALLVALLVF